MHICIHTLKPFPSWATSWLNYQQAWPDGKKERCSFYCLLCKESFVCCVLVSWYYLHLSLLFSVIWILTFFSIFIGLVTDYRVSILHAICVCAGVRVSDNICLACWWLLLTYIRLISQWITCKEVLIILLPRYLGDYLVQRFSDWKKTIDCRSSLIESLTVMNKLSK